MEKRAERTFPCGRYDKVVKSDAVTFQYIREVEDVSELAHDVEQNKVFAAIPHAKELRHEGTIVLP